MNLMQLPYEKRIPLMYEFYILIMQENTRNWVILDYEEANGPTIRPWAPFNLTFLFSKPVLWIPRSYFRDQILFSIIWTYLFIKVYYRWLNWSNSWKCSSGYRITWYILCGCSFSFCSIFRSCNCYILWNYLLSRKDCWI